MVHQILPWQSASGARAELRRAVCALAAYAFALVSPPAWAQMAPYPSSGALSEARAQAVTCMTDAIVHEAGLEPLEGQQAVAQVIMNRAHSAIYPATVCGVIYQGSTRRTGCQFTFTCDGSLRRKIPDRLFLSARPIAEAAVDGALPDRVGNATFYHAYYVSPRWAPQLNRVGRIGAHIFYANRSIRGGLSEARSFTHYPSTAPTRPATISAPIFSPWGLPLPRQAQANAAPRTID